MESKRPRIGGGSRKGIPNKVTKELRELIRGALDEAGGQKYLVNQATENPVAFMGLIGKIIPKEVNATLMGDGDRPIVSKVTFEVIGGSSGKTD